MKNNPIFCPHCKNHLANYSREQVHSLKQNQILKTNSKTEIKRNHLTYGDMETEITIFLSTKIQLLCCKCMKKSTHITPKVNVYEGFV